MIQKPLVGVLLAAGYSRRFGSDKLMCRLPDGKPVAVRACRTLLSGTDRVVAVVRPGQDALSTALAQAGADVVAFEDARRGMGVSLAFGVWASSGASGWLIGLADMPWIRADTVCTIAAELRSGAALAAPVWQGRRGHPVGFSADFRAALCELDGDQGAKVLLEAHSHRMQLVPCDDPGIIRDVDHPADLDLTRYNAGGRS